MIVEDNGFIRPSGPALVIKLWQFNGNKETINADYEMLKEDTVLMKYTRFYEGFSNIQKDENSISADYVMGRTVTVQKFDLSTKKLVPSTIFSHGTAKITLRYDLGIVETRGTSWAAKMAINKLEQVLAGNIKKYSIPKEKFFDLTKQATMLTNIKVNQLKEDALQSISLFGAVQDSHEWKKMMKNKESIDIEFLRAQLMTPTRQILSCMINNSGSLLIYKKGDGIAQNDVNWLIAQLV